MSKKVAYYGVFTALAILMSYVERMIPVPVAVPGIKLGLANIVIVLVLYTMETRDAFYISIVRILIAGVLFSGFAGFMYSAAGAIFSFFAMSLLKKSQWFSMIGVSVIGGIAHNIGQIIMAMIMLKNTKVIYYLPVLLISGVVTGVVVGITAKSALSYIQHVGRH